jgi:hypothetical protein
MRSLLALLTLLAAVRSAAAQSPAIAPGDPVRITAPDLGVQEREAVFEAMRGDTMFLRATGKDTSHWTVPLSAITLLEVNHGNKPPARHVWQGAAIVGGLAFATIYTMRQNPSVPCVDFCSRLSGPNGWTIVLGTTAIAAVLGAAFGYVWTSEPFTKEKVPVPPTVSIAPDHHGVLMTVGWSF